jgi:Tfp pilus assembly protein PilN
MRAVNLLPADQRTKSLRVKPSKRGVVGLGLVAATGAVGLWGFTIHQSLGDADRQLQEAQAEQSSLQAQVGSYAAAQQRKNQHEQQKGLVIGLAQTRVNWERIIRDTATVMPKQTWLTALKAASPSLATQAPAPAPTPAPQSTGSQITQAPAPAPTPLPAAGSEPGLHLEGFAYTQRQVALLMVRVSSVPGLSEAKVASSEIAPRGGRKLLKFTIDVPIDLRSQDRPVFAPSGTPATTTTNG